MSKISQYFSMEEFIKSATADRLGIRNFPNDEVACNLKILAVNVLDPIRELACGPIKITSGYRCCELNYKVGGSPNSDHIYGQAADFGPGYPVDDLDRWLDEMYRLIIRSPIKYHQLIREPTWLHISYRIDNQCRHWRNDGTKSETA